MHSNTFQLSTSSFKILILNLNRWICFNLYVQSVRGGIWILFFKAITLSVSQSLPLHIKTLIEGAWIPLVRMWPIPHHWSFGVKELVSICIQSTYHLSISTFKTLILNWKWWLLLQCRCLACRWRGERQDVGILFFKAINLSVIFTILAAARKKSLRGGLSCHTTEKKTINSPKGKESSFVP